MKSCGSRIEFWSRPYLMSESLLTRGTHTGRFSLRRADAWLAAIVLRSHV